MRSRFLLLVALTFVLVAALGGVAYADTAADNAQCLTCHGPDTASTAAEVDFGVGPVDKTTACNKCHWINNHPYHFAESQCGGTCHKAWFKPPRTTFYQSVVPVNGSYFSTVGSVDASSETLHDIHTKRTWIAEAAEYRPACATCHAAASCEACHDSAIGHGQHGVAGDPAVGDPTMPVTTNTAPGVAPGTIDLTNRSITADNACAASACHGAPESHERVDDMDSGITYTGTWSTAVNAGYLGGSVTSTTEAGASFEATFEGTGFAWIGAREFNGGIAEVYVDELPVVTVDTFNTPWGFGRTVYWTGGLPAGTHTVRVVNTGMKNTSSGGTRVSIQLLDFRADGSFEAVPSCSSCHFTFAEHYNTTAHSSYPIGCSGAGCHTTPDLMTVHNERNAAFSCGGCHDSILQDVQDAIAAGDTACTACHGTVSGLGGHRTAHWPVPLLEDAAGPHYSYYDGSEGTSPTGDCMTCHTQNLVDEHMGIKDSTTANYIRFPQLDSAGDPLTCGTCHDPGAGTVVQDAIARGKSMCEACHPVHGPINDVHASAFVDLQEVPCADCHSADLVAEHSGGGKYVSTAGLAGCDVCHNLFTDMTSGSVEGTATQNAISVSNDTRCSACHTAYHVNSTAHQASTTASLECATCHDGGGTSTIDVAATALHPTCATCHKSTRLGTVSGHTAECSSCHEGHGDLTVAHTTASSQGCTDCHGSTDVRTLHATSEWGECDVCHKANARSAGRIDWATADQECASCHSYEPVETAHYPAAKHLASHTQPCNWCHYMDLKREHAKADVNVTCVGCHTDPQDKNVIAAGWNQQCDKCHFGGHDDYAVAELHTSTSACSASGCHATSVITIHSTKGGCVACHTSPGQPRSELTKDCATSGCHDTYHKDLPGLHTSTSSTSCTRCHDTDALPGADVAPLHKQVCSKCHNTTIDAMSKTAECTACHNTTVSPYHGGMDGAHEFSAMGTTCQQAGCHLKTLPEEHAKYLGRYAGYDDSCALCHLNTDSNRIDWTTASADCTTCHTVHGDIDELHTSTSSQACVDCHESADVRNVHGASPDASCAVCHNAAATRIDWTAVRAAADGVACVNCHGPASAKPLDPADHYPLDAHLATQSGCGQCHYMDMKAEHSRVAVPVSCVTCHQTKVDAFTAPWDKTCSACHDTDHTTQTITKHVSTTATCSGTGCHNITDVAVLHGATDGPGCGACHVSADKPATTTDCTASGCHAGVGTDHKGLHEAAGVNPNGCAGCHFMNLVDEHAKVNLTCATCHSSSVPAVSAAIAANDLRCKSCHPTMHSKQDWEFNPGRASLHRVSPDLPGMRSSFIVNGTTYTWSLPAANTFLKAGLTTSSMMTCADCHSYSGATGPHGATMKVNIDPAYPNPYKVTTGGASSTAQLSPNSPTGMSMSDSGRTAAGIICEKCHDLYNGSWSNVAHKEHDDRGIEGAYCNQCHIAVPHGWSRPRMLGYVTDAAPYATWGGTSRNGGLARITIKNYTPNGWGKADCGAACSSSRHPLNGSSWPAADGAVTPPAPTTGSVSGTVSSGSAAVSGATVSIAGKTATTAASGTYSVTGITAGTYTMTVSATGYTTQTVSVTIAAGGSATQNVSLTAAPPAPTTGSVSGTVSSGSAAVSGATVSIAGKTATTAASGTYSVTGITAGTYTMTVSATGYTTQTVSVTITAGGSATQNVSLVAVQPTEANLARTSTASASTTSGSYSASRAIDGSASSEWRSSSTSGTQWLRVNLGSAKTVNKVVVNWTSGYYARSYRIETSNDGITWASQSATTSGNGGIDTITLASVSAQYVRVSCTSAYSRYGYRINEFEVWGY